MSKYTPFSLFIRQCLLYPLASPFLPAEEDVKLGVSYASGQKTGTFSGSGQKSYPVDQILTDNGDGTVSDNTTGLMWAKDGNGLGCNSGGLLSFANAITWANGLSFAGHTDWRMPTIREAHTIINFSGFNPPVYNPPFVNMKPETYWTSTPHPLWSANGYYISYFDGRTTSQDKANALYVMAVRTIT